MNYVILEKDAPENFLFEGDTTTTSAKEAMRFLSYADAFEWILDQGLGAHFRVGWWNPQHEVWEPFCEHRAATVMENLARACEQARPLVEATLFNEGEGPGPLLDLQHDLARLLACPDADVKETDAPGKGSAENGAAAAMPKGLDPRVWVIGQKISRMAFSREVVRLDMQFPFGGQEYSVAYRTIFEPGHSGAQIPIPWLRVEHRRTEKKAFLFDGHAPKWREALLG